VKRPHLIYEPVVGPLNLVAPDSPTFRTRLSACQVSIAQTDDGGILVATGPKALSPGRSSRVSRPRHGAGPQPGGRHVRIDGSRCGRRTDVDRLVSACSSRSAGGTPRSSKLAAEVVSVEDERSYSDPSGKEVDGAARATERVPPPDGEPSRWGMDLRARGVFPEPSMRPTRGQSHLSAQRAQPISVLRRHVSHRPTPPAPLHRAESSN
jgi:hypothetical protein